MKHCCDQMAYYATEKNSLLDYSPSTRGYSFILHDASPFTHKTMWYCPWCGKKLPKALGEEWDDYLEKEYNLTVDDIWDDEGYWHESKIPQEFRTDEWWKKRNL